jgi:uncharacterized RDD family membrane protein YckC
MSDIEEAKSGRALLRVLQRLVGFVELFEALLGGLVAGVAVGVAILGKLAKGCLEVVVARVAFHAERLVVAAFCHLAAIHIHWSPYPFGITRHAGAFAPA